MEDPRKLRELAGWYREFAERAGSPAIWHARLVTAKDLEREADRLEKMAARGPRGRAAQSLSKTEDPAAQRRSRPLLPGSSSPSLEHGRLCHLKARTKEGRDVV